MAEGRTDAKTSKKPQQQQQPQRQKSPRVSANICADIEEQSDGSLKEMDVDGKEVSKTGSRDTRLAHRLTFRADPDLLEPREKQRKKLSRNEIEKLRRDRLNAHFMELAKIVPLIMESEKKIDKASILRLTVAYLRIYNDLVKGSRRSKQSCNWRPDLTMHENLGNVLLESFGGFLLVISRKGILIFATEAITKYLGHNLSDVLGNEVRNIIHPSDYDILMKQFEATSQDAMIDDTDDDTDVSHVPVNGQRSFCLKMLNVLNPQSTCYEVMHLVGHLKKITPIIGSDFTANASFSGAQPTPEPYVSLVAVARLVSHQPILDLVPNMNSMPNQWITRHELDGKITYSDQRGALLTGFLPGESIGFSPYMLVHPDDVSSVVAVHNLFLTAGCVPLTVFRMVTKSREILYVQTDTHLVVDMWTSKPKFIISINTVLEEHDGELALERQRLRIQRAESSKARAAITSGEENESADDASPYSNPRLSQERSSCFSENSPAMSVSSDGSWVSPEVEVEGSSVVIVVGEMKYPINLSDVEALDPKNTVHDSSINIAFDSHATEDDGGKCIPIVKPSFIDDAPAYCEQASPKTVAQRRNTLLANSRDAERRRHDDGSDFAKGFINGKNSISSADVFRRRFSDGDANSVISLSELAKMSKAAKGLNRGNVLLRQLLTEKSDVVCFGHEVSRGTKRMAAASSPSSSGSSVGIVRQHSGPSTDDCHQIKSLLGTDLISSAIPTAECFANDQNSWRNLRNLPNSTSQSSSFDGCVGDASADAAARFNSLNGFKISRQTVAQTHRRRTKPASRTDTAGLSTPMSGINFESSARGDGRDALQLVRNDCERIYPSLDSHRIYSSQNSHVVPQNASAAVASGHCVNDFAHFNGHHMSGAQADVLCSSVVGLPSQMSHDGNYRESRQQFIGPTGQTFSADGGTNDSGGVKSQRQLVNFPLSFNTAESSDQCTTVLASSSAAPQITSPHAVVDGKWHRNSDVVIGEGSTEGCSNVMNDGWSSTFTDFDETLALAQQNDDDISSFTRFWDEL